MSKENLPPDPESLEQWQKLPQNAPSRQALPPMTAGMRGWLWFAIFVAVLIALGLLLQRWPG